MNLTAAPATSARGPNLVACCLLATLLAACGDDTGSSSGSGGGGTGGSTSQTTDASSSSDASSTSTDASSSTSSAGQGGAGDGLTREALIGTWENDCYVEAGTIYAQSRYVFSEMGIVVTYHQYLDDPTCSDEATLQVEQDYRDSSWTLGDVLASGALEHDHVNQQRVITTLTDQATSDWNAGSGCGPFTTGAARDVSGMTCFGYPYPAVGGTAYDAIFPEGPDIRFPQPSSGDSSSPEQRPTLPEPGVKGLFHKVE